MDAEAKQRMETWTRYAFLIPLIALLVAWSVSFLLYRWVIVCGGGGVACKDGGGLRQLREPLAGLPLQSEAPVRVAHDIAARFAWQPTLVAFVVVGLGVIVSCWYLIHRSLQDSCSWYTGGAVLWTDAALAVVAVGLGMGIWHLFPVWIVHTEVLAPTLEAALGPNDAAVRTAERIQQLVQVLASVASAFVVGAASAALLTPKREDPEASLQDAEIPAFTSHLADQWRRLSLTLYAGAALLVSAVIHQSTMYGWGNAFAEAVAESRTLQAQGEKSELDSLNIELRFAKALILRDTAAKRADTTDTAKIRPDSELQKKAVGLAFQADSVKEELARDSISGGTREGAMRATMKRIGDLMTRAITRGGGLVYTILLAVTYLPAALVLIERAWELSRAAPDAGENAKARGEWRVAEGIGFSLGDQWTKIFAVLSPVLASGSAVALTELFKLIS